MIGRLTGRIVDDDADGTLLVDVHGVAYEVLAPLGTRGRVVADAAGAVTLWVHTHVREDALLLYGFAAREDREAFRQLIAISNVGPKMAIALLGSMTAGDLARVIARAEVGKLTSVPGIGKKTAERLLLELKGKLTATPTAGGPPAAPGAAPAEDRSQLLVSALTRLGFRPAEAERALVALGDRVETQPLGELVREALAVLSAK